MSDKASMRILIVEDSLALALLAARKLQKTLGCETVLAHSLAETRRILESAETPFFAAVLDMNLPDAPEGEVVDYVVSKGLSSIVLTGTFGEEWREALLSKHVVDYVIKRDASDFDYIADLIRRIELNASIQVLVADDSLSYRSYIRRLLQAQNFQVLEAVDGQEALDILSAHPQIRLIVTDNHMPRIDGVGLVSRVRQIYSPEQLAVIGISSESDATLSARFLKSGGSDFLSKPFSTEEFNCRVRLNLERIEQLEALRHSLETKNRFMGIAAHDLRNPLSNIQGFSRLLLKSTHLGSLSPKQQELLQTVISESRHMYELLNNLLDLSAIESGNLTLNRVSGNLKLLIAERLYRNRLLAEQKQIEVQSELAELPELSLDTHRFAQILDNLLSNAIKYSHPGTVVTLRLFAEAEHFKLQVEDQGQGMSAEDLLQLFGDFQKLSSRPTGGESSTGLGLAIVKRMVEAHGWWIQARSVLGQGSIFEIEIPKAPTDPGQG